MIYFPPLRTRRLAVQLRELSIGDSLALAAMPGHAEEANTTAFLRCAIDASKMVVEDPARWTVQERMLAVCHYLSATTDDGPDFSLGAGRYSDYLQGEADIQTSVQTVEIGEVGGDIWHVRHLTGAMAESIERMVGEIDGLSGRLHWIFGAMAAQLVRAGEDVPDAAEGEGAFDEFLLSRVMVLKGYQETDFSKLMALYLKGRDKLHHFFKLEFTEDGIVAMSKGGAADSLPPARFPVHPCLSRLARELVGKPDGDGV